MCAGGAVAGPVAAGALVGIGAAALTGGVVLDAIGFPHSPGKVIPSQAVFLMYCFRRENCSLRKRFGFSRVLLRAAP